VDFTGKRVLIGGGSRGIGRAIAQGFAQAGARVSVSGRDREALAETQRLSGAHVQVCDLADGEAVRAHVEAAAEALGGLDIVVNNAAYQQSKQSIDEITAEQFDRTMKTNVYAMFHISKAAVPLMKPGACFINTASVNSVNPGEELLDYATTKGAIMVFTKGLAKQLGPKGIRVNAVAPGPVWTPLQVAGGQLPGKMGEFGQDTPLGRAGQPAELASLYVTLAESGTSFTSGSVFGANGGTGVI